MHTRDGAGDRPEIVQGSGAAVLDELGADLDDLLAAAGAPITARRPWLACWARHHTDWRPWVVGVRLGGRLRGAAVLARQVRRGVARVAMLGHGESDYCALPVRAPADALPLALAVERALRRQRRPWTVHLEQLPVGDPVVAALRARLRSEIGPADPCVIVPIDPPGADLRAFLAARARKNTRNAAGRVRRDGVALEVRRLRGRTEVLAALPEIHRVRRAGNAAKGLDDHADLAYRGFWGEILPLLAERGELDVTELRLDGDLACYAVCLRDGTAYRGWDTRLDPRFARYSPGHLLRDAILGQLAGEQWTEYDLMRGTEAYKNALDTRQRDLVELRAWSSPVLRLPRRARRTAAALRDRHPRLIDVDQRVRTALRGPADGAVRSGRS
ncbi:MAG TPA: GNAT family N-acetyltransferase [Streptosporangiaceae bacterium]